MLLSEKLGDLAPLTGRGAFMLQLGLTLIFGHYIDDVGIMVKAFFLEAIDEIK